MSSHTKNVPSLDFLRSLAIGTVVLAHSVLAFGAPAAISPLQFGGTGVDLFFVLSGWLLGRQLMQELRARGTINLARFWSRRWMRTLPAYYAVLIATLLQQFFVNHNHDLRWSYFVFGQNYLTSLPYFYVSWSLCVEEHFYLLVGPLLVLAFMFRRWGVALLGTAILVPLICRTTHLYRDIIETHVRFDECLAGVALAGASVFVPAIWKRLCGMAPAIAGGGAILYGWLAIAGWIPSIAPLKWVDEQTLCIGVFGSFLLLAVSSESWQTRLFVPGAGYLAKRAYSVYLLHPESLALLRRMHVKWFPLFFVLVWALTLLASELLYRIIEKPLMDARERFAVSRSQGVARRAN